MKGALLEQDSCPEATLGSLEMLWLNIWAQTISNLCSCRQALEIVDGRECLVQQGYLDLGEAEAAFQSAFS